MGLGYSAQTLSTNKYVVRFCGEQPISSGDEFWTDMFNSKALLSDLCSHDSMEVIENSLKECLHRLSLNNPATRNVQALEQLLIKAFTEILDGKAERVITYPDNGLILFRMAFKYFLCLKENRSLKDIVLGSDPTFESFLTLLMRTLETPKLSYDGEILAEVEGLLLLCVSSTRLQLQHFIVQKMCDPIFMTANRNHKAILLNILRIICWDGGSRESEAKSANLSGKKTPGRTIRGSAFGEASRTSASMHLFCLLVCWDSDKSTGPYRNALPSLLEISDQADNGLEVNGKPPHYQDKTKLCQSLCDSTFFSEEGILFLYLLLYNCKHFRSVFLSRANSPDLLVMYLLNVIDQIQGSCPHHHSMCLVILLILTEDDFFTTYLHSTIVPIPSWHKSRRSLPPMSASNFTFLVILKQLKRNLFKSKDPFLSNNCAGILCNLSHGLKHMHWFTSFLLVDTIKAAFQSNSQFKDEFNLNNSMPPNAELNNTSDETLGRKVDLTAMRAVRDVIYVLIDIMNIVLCKHLKSNADLLYFMLYENSLFGKLYEQVPLTAMSNVNKITEYLRQIYAGVSDPTDEQLKTQIAAKIKLFPVSQLELTKEIRFRYMEQGDSSRFFMPYIWSMIYETNYLGRWPSENFKIMNGPPTSSG